MHPCLLRFLAAAALSQLVACSMIFGDDEAPDETTPQEEAGDVEPEKSEMTKVMEEESEPVEDASLSEPKEVGAEKVAPSSQPEGDLLRSAEKLYQTGMFTLARQSFQTLRDQYPMGAYAAMAEIKLADTFFYNSEFSDAAKRYEEYTKNYPASPDVPYVKLQAARSLVRASKGGGRDRSPHEKALTLLDSLITEYPNTTYAALADQERLKVAEELASHDRMVMEFYEKRENTAAVESRRKAFNQRWGAALSPRVPPTVLVDGPMVAVSQRAKPRVEYAQPAVTPLAAVIEEEARSDTQEANTTTPSAPQMVSSRKAAPNQMVRIQRVNCRDRGQPFAEIEVQEDLSAVAAELFTAPFEPSDEGVVTIPSLAVVSKQLTFDCFDEGDLTISDNGQIQLRADTPVTVATLTLPPRLLLIPK